MLILRLSLDEKIYESELQLALEISRSESSQEAKNTPQDEDVTSQEEKTSEIDDVNVEQEDKENNDTKESVVQVNEMAVKEDKISKTTAVLANNDGEKILVLPQEPPGQKKRKKNWFTEFANTQIRNKIKLLAVLNASVPPYNHKHVSEHGYFSFCLF